MTRTETPQSTQTASATVNATSVVQPAVRARCNGGTACRCGQTLDGCSLARCPRCGCSNSSC